jgi:hypothetical protein
MSCNCNMSWHIARGEVAHAVPVGWVVVMRDRSDGERLWREVFRAVFGGISGWRLAEGNK